MTPTPVNWLQTLFLSSALFIITALVYWPGLSGDFLFDDFPNIVTNPAVHAETINLETLNRAATAYEPGTMIGRPLATISFAINYALDGKNPWGYKLGNLLIHLINSLLIFILAQRILRTNHPAHHPAPLGHPSTGGELKPSLVPFAITLLWAIHPLQVSSVLYIVQRMEILALTFNLLALLAYLHGRTQQQSGQSGWNWLGVALLLAGIGLLSKETAVLFPAYTLALELTLLGFAAKAQRTTKILQGIYGIGVVIALALFTFVLLPKYGSAGHYLGRDFSLDERLFSQLRILVMYLGQIILPRPGSLTFYYDDYQISHGWLDPATTLLSGLLLFGLFISAWLLRKRRPLYALGIFWFFIGHLLTSTIFPLELVYEHRNYFPLFGILLALADLIRDVPCRDHPRLRNLCTKPSQRRILNSPPVEGCPAGAGWSLSPKPTTPSGYAVHPSKEGNKNYLSGNSDSCRASLKPIAISAVIALFAFLTVIRSATWGDPLLLATDLVANNPNSTRASSDLATLYIAMSDSNPDSPFFNMGAQEFERAAQLPNSSPLPEQSLIIMAATVGQPVQDIWWERLQHKLQTQAIGTQASLTVSGLINARYKGIEIDPQRIAQVYEIILARSAQPPIRYVEYAKLALDDLHNSQLAGRLFAQAVARNPKDVEYALRITGALLEDGHIEPALAVIEKAQELRLLDPKRQFNALKARALQQQ